MKKVILAFLFAGLSLFLTGCGGGSSEVSSASTPTPTPITVTYTIGGTVSGLNGSLTIKNNAADELVINSSGQFTFATHVVQGGQYNVTITTQPSTQTCTLSNYFGNNVSVNVTTVLISCTDNPPGITSLSLSTTTLALATSGTPRIFIVTNTGQNSASSLSISTNPALPSGTTSVSTCGVTLAPGSSCTVTITPGSTASTSASAGSTAIPSAITISGSNTNNISGNVYVLTYGSIYQAGYIFSIDESPSITDSIKGKIWALNDQSPSGGTKWSTTYNNIPGIYENSAALQCNGANDGPCNTTQIVNYYSQRSVPLGSYAAGLCKSEISGYGDWYLPTICELNYARSTAQSISCSSNQDIQSKLVTSGVIPLYDYYQSSTESSANPSNDAWVAVLSQYSGSDFVNTADKGYSLAVRCARGLTN